MKKTLCLLICTAMLFGIISNVVSANPAVTGDAEIRKPEYVQGNNGIDLPDDTGIAETHNTEYVQGNPGIELPDIPIHTDPVKDPVITKVEGNRITLVRGYKCHIDGYYNDQDEYVEYNRYDYEYIPSELMIYFTDSDPVTLEFLRDGFYYKDTYYEIEISDDQHLNPWGAGVHAVNCKVLDCEFTVEVEIIDSYIERVEVPGISFLQGMHLETCIYNDEYGNELSYRRYDPFTVGADITLFTVYGEEIKLTSLGDRFEYKEDNYGVEFTDDGGQKDTPWGVGLHTITCTVINFEFTVEVQILASPVVDIKPAPLTLINGCNCRTSWYYDDAAGEYKQYTFYDIYNGNIHLAIEVYFADGSMQTISGLYDSVEYDGEYYAVEWDDDQDKNPWTEQTENRLKGRLLGYDFAVPVEIIESPVTGVDVKRITVVKECGGDWMKKYDEATGDYVDWYHYNTDRMLLDAEVAFVDGFSLNVGHFGNCMEYMGVGYEMTYNDNQYNEPWNVGVNYVACSMFGYDFTVEVEVIECPVVSVSSQRATIIKNCSGYLVDNYDEASDTYITFHYYSLYGVTANIKITMNDGSTAELSDIYDTFEYKGVVYSLKSSDGQFDNPWDVGVNTVKCSVLGYDFEVEYDIIESPVTDIRAAELTFIKNTHGSDEIYYDNELEEFFVFYHYNYYNVGIPVTVTLADGSELSINSFNDTIEYMGVRYGVWFNDPQYTKPWDVGTHAFSCTMMGYDFPVTVNIIENPIESITADPVSFYDGAFNAEAFGTVNGEQVRYRYYYYLGKCRFNVNFKDGTSFVFDGDSFKYAGMTYEVKCVDDQGCDNVWSVGDHQVECELTGIKIPLTVRIIESPVKSVTAEKYTMIEGAGTRNESYPDGHGGQINYTVYDGVYRNTFITVEFKDGTVVRDRINNGVMYDNEHFDVITEDDQRYDNVWGVGMHQVNCSLLGCDFVLDVEIVPSPVDRVEASDIYIAENTHTEQVRYYDHMIGDWVEYSFYNYSDLCSFTVYYKDGTSAEMSVGSILRYGDLEIFFEREDDQNEANVWGPGTHKVGGKVGGCSVEFNVIIKENPVQSFDVHDAVVYEAQTYDYFDEVRYLQKHITFDVTTKNGEVYTGNLYDGVVIDGMTIKPDTDNIFERLYISVTEYECSLGELEDSFAVTVMRNPFDNASPASRIRVADDSEKVLKTAVVDGREVQYYAYEWSDQVGDIRIFLTNDVAEHILGSASYSPNEEYTEDEFNRVWENLDRAGERFADSIIRCAVDRFADEYSVNTVGMTADQLRADQDMMKIFAGIIWRYLEVTGDGRYTGVSTGTEYTPGQFDEAALWNEIRLAYTDPGTGITDYAELSMLEAGYDSLFRCVEWETGIERAITVHDRTFTYDGAVYTIEMTDDQMNEEWKKGENYGEILIIDDTGSVMRRGGFGIDLYKSVKVQNVTVEPETVYGFDAAWVDTENGAFKEYRLNPSELNVTLTVDGVSSEIALREWWMDNRGGNIDIEFDYDGEVLYLSLSGWQSEETPWHAGENVVNFELCGFRSSFTVTVVETESVMVDNMTIMEGAQTDEFGIYHYFPHITVTYTNGDTITSDDEEFRYRYHVDVTDTQDQTRWDIGKHAASVTINGEYETAFEVEIIENTAVSASADDMKLFEDKDGYRFAVYNSKTGKYERGDVFEGDIEATVTFKDGSTVSGTGEIEYNGTAYPIDIVDILDMLNPYCLGSGAHVLTFEVMGQTAVLNVEIIESYYDTHAYVTSDSEELLSVFNVIDDDKYEKGTVININGLNLIDDMMLYFAVSDSLDGNPNFYIASITAEKDGRRVKPDGKVRVTLDLSFITDAAEYEIDANDIALFSSDRNGKLTRLIAVVDAENMSITFELNDDEYYVAALINAADINGDGSADNKDVVTLFRYVSASPSAEYDITYDFNKDGKVGNKDVTLLFRYISNK